MENWTSVVKGRSNTCTVVTCTVVGDKIFGWNTRTFKLHEEIAFLSIPKVKVSLCKEKGQGCLYSD